MNNEEAKAKLLYKAWELAHQAEKDSAAKKRAETTALWTAYGVASKEADAALWREKVEAGPDLAPGELEALGKSVEAAKEELESVTLANHAAISSMYAIEDKFKWAKKFDAARKKLAAREKPE